MYTFLPPKRLLSGRHISAYELCVWLRMPTLCHSLSYADARRQHFGRWLSERSEHGVIRTRTSELVAYAEKFYACTKILCVCRRTFVLKLKAFSVRYQLDVLVCIPMIIMKWAFSLFILNFRPNLDLGIFNYGQRAQLIWGRYMHSRLFILFQNNNKK